MFIMSNIDFKFEVKNMGIMFWVPVVVMIISMIYFIYITDSSIELKLAFPMLEFILVPFSSWWIIYLYYDYFDRDGLEILLSYPLTNAEHGLLRILLFIIFYTILSLFLFIYVSSNSSATLLVLLLQYIPQFLFFGGISFFLMTLFRNSSIAITIIAFYVTTEVLTKGQFIPWYHVFFANEVPLGINDVINKSILNLILSFLFIKMGGYGLKIEKIF